MQLFLPQLDTATKQPKTIQKVKLAPTIIGLRLVGAPFVVIFIARLPEINPCPHRVVPLRGAGNPLPDFIPVPSDATT